MATKKAIGIIELSSITKGYQVQDAVLKATNTEKLVSRSICPGKYFIVIGGDVADIEIAISIAQETGGYAIVNVSSIPNLDPQVFPAITGSIEMESSGNGTKVGALLIIETFSVVSAIKAADFAAKEADLNIRRIHVAMAIGGKGLVVITGEISALEAAAVPAIEYCKEDGMLGDYTIIKNPHEDVLKELI